MLLHFPLNPVLNLFLFFQESGFDPFFLFPSLHLVHCNYVPDRLVGGFSHLFSFAWFNFCVVTIFVVN
jgi:hypothetical protein